MLKHNLQDYFNSYFRVLVTIYRLSGVCSFPSRKPHARLGTMGVEEAPKH